MTVYDLKPAFQNLLRPICRSLAFSGVTANQVTMLACLMSIAMGVAVALNISTPAYFFLLPIGLFIRMALNAIDGMLAREHGQKSKLGGILNELTDVISDSAIYLPFALLPGTNPVLVVGIVLVAQLTELAGVLGTVIGASRRYDGPMGKSDRAFVFGLLGLLIALRVPLEPHLNYVWILVLVLSVKTVWNRCARALKQAQGVASV